MGDHAQAALYAAPIFRDFMTVALKDKPDVPFRVPPGIKLISVDPHSGMRPSSKAQFWKRLQDPEKRLPILIAAEAARRSTSAGHRSEGWRRALLKSRAGRLWLSTHWIGSLLCNWRKEAAGAFGDEVGRFSKFAKRRRPYGGDQYADAGGGSRMGGGHLGLGTVALSVGLIGYMTGINPAVLIGGAEMLNNMRGGGQVRLRGRAQRGTTGQPTDQMGQFVAKKFSAKTRGSLVAGSAGAKRTSRFSRRNWSCSTAKPTRAAARRNGRWGRSIAQSIIKSTLDTSFFRDMKTRFRGGGDFAYAYVIWRGSARASGNQLGILPKVHQAQERAGSQAEANALSVPH